MKKLYSLPGIILAIIFLIFSSILIKKSIDESKEFKQEKSKVAEILNFNDRLLSFRDWVFTEKSWKEKKANFETSLTKADEHYKKAVNYGNYLLYTCLGFLLIIIIIYAKRRFFFGLTFGFSIIALAMLGQGVTNPILEMAAFKNDMTIKVYVRPNDIPHFEEAVQYMDNVASLFGDLNTKMELVRIIPYANAAVDKIQPILIEGQQYLIQGKEYLVENADNEVGMDKVFDGRTYFYYQNKSIMDVITLLLKNNKPVAVAIGLFSVIIPSVKLLFTLFILLFPIRGAKRLRKFLSYIAKWSMADVFVVSAFLAYLSFSNMSPGVEMEANVLYGLYFFGGYVLISIALGFLLDASIREKTKISDKNVMIPIPEEPQDNILIVEEKNPEEE